MSSWLRIKAFRMVGLESSEMKHMIHMIVMMGMMDGMTRMTPECPIICSSNHIDDASGLLCPHAKGISRPETSSKVPATQILIRSCQGWMMPQLELLLVLVSLPW